MDVHVHARELLDTISPNDRAWLKLAYEAMHVVSLLVGDARTATPATHARYALMCIDAARLPERTDAAGNLKTLFEQDRSRWDVSLVAEGLRYLERSARGTLHHGQVGEGSALRP